MERPSPLSDGATLSVQFPLCTIDTSVVELSGQTGIPLQHWVEPGMGEATGFGCRLANGIVVFFEEFAHARENFGSGPTIYVEASELIENGIDGTLFRVLEGLGLSDKCVTWLQTESGVQAAKLVVQAARERARRKNGV